MAEEVTAATGDLKAQFEEARLAGDHARMEAIGRRLYPEPAVEDVMAGRGTAKGDAFDAAFKAANVAAFAKEDAAKGTGTLSPRAVIVAVNLELEKGHHTERRRQELIAERDQAYRDAFTQTEQAAEAASRAKQAAAPATGYTAGSHPAPPPGETWNAPVLDAVAAQLVGRAVAPSDLSRWLARGAALAQQEPGDAPALDPAVIADARFALQAFLPEHTMRAQVERFLSETGLGNDEPFIRELAAKGAPLRRELEQARKDRYRLGTLNAGSREYVDTAAALTARYQRIYGGS